MKPTSGRTIAIIASSVILAGGVATMSQAVNSADTANSTTASIGSDNNRGEHRRGERPEGMRGQHPDGMPGGHRQDGGQLKQLVDAVADADSDEARLNAANELAAAVKALRDKAPAGNGSEQGREPGADRPQLSAEQRAQLDSARKDARTAMEKVHELMKSFADSATKQ